jgi:hypothetical protein
MNLELSITGINTANRRVKMLKAIRAMSKSLGVPVSVETKGKVHGHEPYLYPIQQELANRWADYYSPIIQSVYYAAAAALELPRVEVETMKKAIDDDVLRYKGRIGKILSIFGYKGRIVYNPETGQPISVRDFNNLVDAIQKFLDRNTKDAAKRIVLDSTAIGKLLKRIARYSTDREMKNLKLDSLKYRGKTFDWIRDDFKNLEHVLGEPFTRSEAARYQVAADYVGQLVTRTNDNIRNEIKQTVLNGIREHRSKGQVSQDLFNRLGSMNRDWKRIADTEIVNTANLAGILEDVHNAPEGEKVYFKRYELPGCCEKCAEVKGKVVLWSDAPLADERIKDEHADIAIWEGKPQEKGRTVLVTGTLHPNCRGGWVLWDAKSADATGAKIRGKAEAWDKAVEKARDEYRENGIENPNDQTKGYKDRINELYRSYSNKGQGQL